MAKTKRHITMKVTIIIPIMIRKFKHQMAVGKNGYLIDKKDPDLFIWRSDKGKPWVSQAELYDINTSN